MNAATTSASPVSWKGKSEMEIYPSDPGPSYSYVTDHEFRTIVSDFESGAEQRRKMWRFPKRTFALIYRVMELTAAKRDAIYEFYANRKGSYEPFWFFDFIERHWVDEFVSYGDGSEPAFDLPSKDTLTTYLDDENPSGAYNGLPLYEEQYDSVPKIYVNSALKAFNTHWFFISGGGSGGADRIHFTPDNTPSVGQLITADLKGRLRIKGRFRDDKLTEELFTVGLENISISVYEVKP